MKKIFSISLGLFLALYLMLVLGFVGNEYDGVLCNGLDVVVRDSLEYRLIKDKDIRNMIQADYPQLAGVPLSSLDVADIEKNLHKVPAIKDVQVFKTVNGRLVVELSQRTPIARVEDKDHRHYYLDREGNVIPAVSGYAPHILLFNGQIDGTLRKQENVRDAMEGLMAMANYIANDPFWSAQIVQVYVDRQGGFELIPRVGAQIILFGDASRLEEKFFKLETLYRKGFRQVGWNQYEIINLKYNNQVICTKR
jgi:cell division protein FtsQ